MKISPKFFDANTALKKMAAWRGDVDEVWYRGAAGTPKMHNSMGTHVSQIEFEMGRILMALVRRHKPEVLVEIGTNRGYSTSCLLLAMEKNKKGGLTTFDIEDVNTVWWRPQCWELLEIPTTRLTCVAKPVWELDKLPSSIDFVFHDASHEVDQTLKELEVLAPRIANNGILTFHDIFLCRHMGEFLVEWFYKDGWDYRELQKGRGLGIAKRTMKND